MVLSDGDEIGYEHFQMLATVEMAAGMFRSATWATTRRIFGGLGVEAVIAGEHPLTSIFLRSTMGGVGMTSTAIIAFAGGSLVARDRRFREALQRTI